LDGAIPGYKDIRKRILATPGFARPMARYAGKRIQGEEIRG
jgi:hypothetical protein